MPRFIERRLEPAESTLAIAMASGVAILLALLIGALLFLPLGADPLDAYVALFQESFGTLRGFGFTLARATPLALIALGTCVAWRSGFGYLGFEGCLLIGAAATTSAAMLVMDSSPLASLPALVFFPLMLAWSFAAGGAWAGGVGLLRSRFGGNEVLISLMANYVAAFLVQYLISGPLRAPGDLPQSPRLPDWTWLPYIIPGTRAHAGILVALTAAFLVWLLIRRTPLGYELIVTGLNPAAARYGGIDVGWRQVQAAFLAGGLAALAGMAEVLGSQHRLVDGLGSGTGFVGIVVALLAKLQPLAVIPTALLYAGMAVGADAMQRRSGVPASVVFILQSLIVLLVLASDLLRYWRVRLSGLGMRRSLPANQG